MYLFKITNILIITIILWMCLTDFVFFLVLLFSETKTNKLQEKNAAIGKQPINNTLYNINCSDMADFDIAICFVHLHTYIHYTLDNSNIVHIFR